jgi:two-component system chemotaxis response regulator CheB
MSDDTPSRVRVLVVDDSRIVRRLLEKRLAEQPEFEVLPGAASGTEAIERIEALRPDVVTLDVTMPDMDGIEVLRRVRGRHPDTAFIMFSALTQVGATATVDALTLGAFDFVPKPSAEQGANAFHDTFEALADKIRAACAARLRGPRAVAPPLLAATPTPFAPAARAIGATRRFHGLFIASSTGGPAALSKFFEAFAQPLPVPVFVAQHMPPMFTDMLAKRLDKEGCMRVREAVEGEAARPGEVLIAPGDFHMRVARAATGGLFVHLDQGDRVNGCRPAADVLFKSGAEALGPGALGVVFTGMGVDGLAGAEAIRNTGGRLLVQDEASAAVWGMPGAVARAGLADAALPPEALADAVRSRLAA